MRCGAVDAVTVPPTPSRPKQRHAISVSGAFAADRKGERKAPKASTAKRRPILLQPFFCAFFFFSFLRKARCFRKRANADDVPRPIPIVTARGSVLRAIGPSKRGVRASSRRKPARPFSTLHQRRPNHQNQTPPCGGRPRTSSLESAPSSGRASCKQALKKNRPAQPRSRYQRAAARKMSKTRPFRNRTRPYSGAQRTRTRFARSVPRRKTVYSRVRIMAGGVKG